MLIELGHFALILAFGTAMVQVLLPMIGAAKGWAGWMAVARPAARLQAGLIGFAFCVLVTAFVRDDFSVAQVQRTSHTLKPLLYKIAGAWAGHEGSMLLWVLVLSLYGAAFTWTGNDLSPRFRARVLAIQAMIECAFLAFCIFASNPFLRLAAPPLEGQGMNPLLQDPGLSFHPPFLYLGYVGLSMVYAFALSGLIGGIDAIWARAVRPWGLVAWVFLTLGLMMGAWWAYYELGWGGFWFWDPVENAALIPWLCATALLHTLAAAEKREAMLSWSVFLAILGFGFALIGTFIVRSGALTSVHSFAVDPARGVMMLFIVALFLGGGLTVYACRAHTLPPGPGYAHISRESALALNSALLCAAGFVVFLGTIWPLVAEATTGRILSVGAPFFNRTVVPFAIVLALFLPFGVSLAWKRSPARPAIFRLLPAAGLALICALWGMRTGQGPMGALAAGLGLWVVLGALTDLAQRCRFRWHRLWHLPSRDFGRALSHAGAGLAFAAIGLASAGAEDRFVTLGPGETFVMGGYSLRLDGISTREGPNYTATVATLSATGPNGPLWTVRPEQRRYPVERSETTEIAFHRGFAADLGLALGDRQSDGRWAIRAHLRPFASWIWIGALLIAAGGALSLVPRKRRLR